MEDAIAAVKNGQIKVIRATKVYSVPKSTLHDLVSGKVKHGDKPGPKPYLSSTEEEELADFLVDITKVGYGRTRKQVHTITGSCARDKGRLQNHQQWPQMDGSTTMLSTYEMKGIWGKTMLQFFYQFTTLPCNGFS